MDGWIDECMVQSIVFKHSYEDRGQIARLTEKKTKKFLISQMIDL